MRAAISGLPEKPPIAVPVTEPTIAPATSYARGLSSVNIWVKSAGVIAYESKAVILPVSGFVKTRSPVSVFKLTLNSDGA